MKKAVFPGSFDPYTIGHHDLILRSLPLFDEVIIAIGVNAQKKYLFTLEERTKALKSLYALEPKVKVESYSGLTVNYCQEINANYLLRGLRTSADFIYERSIAQMNNAMKNEVDTLFLVSKPKYSAISSSIVREIMKNGGDASQFLPTGYAI